MTLAPMITTPTIGMCLTDPARSTAPTSISLECRPIFIRVVSITSIQILVNRMSRRRSMSPRGTPATNFQWDDPYNQVLNFDPNAIYTDHGNYINMPLTFVTPSLTAGQNYVITITADEGSSFDAIVTIKDPNGTIIVNNQDTGTDETINLFPPVTGAYTIVVTNFGGTTGRSRSTSTTASIRSLRLTSTCSSSTWKVTICQAARSRLITTRPTFRLNSA